MSAINNTVGNNIRRVRMARNMTQLDLGEIVGKNQRTISSWEKGLRDPGSDNLRTIADALEISPTELIGHNNTPSDNIYQLIMQDNDMQPDIQINDTLIVSTTAKINDGDIVFVKTGGHEICRKFYRHDGLIVLLAINQKEGMTIYDDSEIEILGRVIEIRRKL